MDLNVSEALCKQEKIKVLISHFRDNDGCKKLQNPIEVELLAMYCFSGGPCVYSGRHRTNTYRFHENDILSIVQDIQPNSKASGGHSQEGYLADLPTAQKHMDTRLGLVSNISHGQQVLTSRIAELTLEYNHIQAENARLAAIVSDLAQGQQRIIDTLSTIAQRTATPAQAAAPADKSIFSFFSTQTKGK